jgi:lipopolysaccharide biosynthesis protein
MSDIGGRRVRSALFHVLRLALHALPLNSRARGVLRNRFLDRFPSVRPLRSHGTMAAQGTVRLQVHSAERAIDHVERDTQPLPTPLPATLIAFYLPQFHSIPENDEWWGKGFTEWRNVTRALPQFEGHVQPRLPGDLGFYDLRNPQVLRDQAELASAYGISAFCMYFYWFGGRTLLELPHRQWLNDASINLPMCLCWANENWTRTWDGRSGETLLAQLHSPEDDLAFIAHVAPYLRDPRYLRVDGKPLLLLYRPGLLPDPHATADRWRTWCRNNGIGDIFLAYVQSFEQPDPRDINFDAAVGFPPNLTDARDITSRQALINADYQGEVLDWRDVARSFTRLTPDYPFFPGINCGWDNEPRRPGRGRTFLHASRRSYAAALRQLVARTTAISTPPIIFINAWNEWAEGAVLEPDARTGYAWLQSTRDALIKRRNDKQAPCAVIHAWYPDVLAEILQELAATGVAWKLVVTTPPDKERLVRSVLSQQKMAAQVEVFPNRGRDILPFLHVASRLLDEGHDVVLKLHTKKSPHIADGNEWRRELVAALVRYETPSGYLALFKDDPTLGLAAPSTHLLPVRPHVGANAAGMDWLARRCGIPSDNLTDTPFPAGSMYWVRLAALTPLLDANLTPSDFQPEAGQIDGTLAHAVERMMGSVVEAAGYRITTEDLHPADTTRTNYRFAR